MEKLDIRVESHLAQGIRSLVVKFFCREAINRKRERKEGRKERRKEKK